MSLSAHSKGKAAYRNIGVAQIAVGSPSTAVEKGIPFVIRKTFAAGTPGAADDVTLYAASNPQKFRLLDAVAVITSTVTDGTVTLRTAAAGAGTALSNAIAAATASTARLAATTATTTVAVSGSLYLRRSDAAIAGEIILTCLAE